MGKQLGLEVILKELNSTYGENTVNRMEDYKKNMNIEFIPTGSMIADGLLGGGFGKGKVVEIFGPESSGKTTLAIHGMAEVQAKGGVAAMIDMEHAFDPSYARSIGVDTDKLILSQPEYGEQALDIAMKMIDTGELDILVIDSVSALIPKRALDGEVGDHNIGIQAKMMSQNCPKIASKANKAGCTVIFINQLRANVGVMYGPSEVTSGGNALKYYASQRIEIRRKEIIKEGEIAVANLVRIKVLKNKLAAPFAEGFTQIKYGVGISKIGEVFTLAVDFEIIQKSGSWFSYGETRLGQGAGKVLLLLEDNPELVEELEHKVKEILLGI